jgi:ribosomal protein S18 acetylase RimI-like enzyme
LIAAGRRQGTRLFDHFHNSSRVIDGPGGLVAFLIGILSPSEPERACIPSVGVAPEARGRGLGGAL